VGVLTSETLKTIETLQRAEATDARVYRQLAAWVKDPAERRTLTNIAADEDEHYATWRRYTGRDLPPRRGRVAWYSLMGRVLGYTFVIKLMESCENRSAAAYEALGAAGGKDEDCRPGPVIPEVAQIMAREQAHEDQLVNMLDEERLHHVGDIVLGLNDALVELTGTIAGLTFALANTRVIALAGIITGVAATLSMAASNYLAKGADTRVSNADALRASLYTGVAYLVTVVALVLPYLIFPARAYVGALVMMLVAAVLIIFAFNYYVGVTRGESYWRRFAQMAALSLGVAALSFVIGLGAKKLLGVEV
jgi:VIT1/CCC1 family predicted Fe2+/Mn2+ transporter